jgi:hypothetical protein
MRRTIAACGLVLLAAACARRDPQPGPTAADARATPAPGEDGGAGEAGVEDATGATDYGALLERRRRWVEACVAATALRDPQKTFHIVVRLTIDAEGLGRDPELVSADGLTEDDRQCIVGLREGPPRLPKPPDGRPFVLQHAYDMAAGSMGPTRLLIVANAFVAGAPSGPGIAGLLATLGLPPPIASTGPTAPMWTAIREARLGWDDCRALATEAAPPPYAFLRLRIGVDGRVAEAHVVQADVRRTEELRCFERRFRTLDFGSVGLPGEYTHILAL